MFASATLYESGPNFYFLQPLRNSLSSEHLHDQLPLHITAEPVHLEQFAVIEGRKVVDIDLASLGEEKGERKRDIPQVSPEAEDPNSLIKIRFPRPTILCWA